MNTFEGEQAKSGENRQLSLTGTGPGGVMCRSAANDLWPRVNEK